MTPRERFRLGSSFHPWFREFWDPIADLMLVSSTFHDIVSRLVRVAFGIQVPLVLGGINERLGFFRTLIIGNTSDYSTTNRVVSSTRCTINYARCSILAARSYVMPFSPLLQLGSLS